MPAEEEAMTTVITQEDASAINWYRELTPVEKRTFWACFGGWALDAMDVQIFSFVIPPDANCFKASCVRSSGELLPPSSPAKGNH